MIVPYNENISFDFEDYREKARKDDKYNGKEHLRRDPKRGTVVCSHWLVGLCSSQESGDCQYLHRLDRSKMPKCRYGTHCKIKNCLLAHVEEEEKPECPFFHQGFCMRGPYCKYRHVKLGPEDLPDVADFNLVLSTGGGGGGAGAAGEPGQPFKKPRKVVNAADGSSIELYKVSLCRYFQERGNCPFGSEWLVCLVYMLKS
jgi:cleavage and polyadenylation specificity factor subunit 4